MRIMSITIILLMLVSTIVRSCKMPTHCNLDTNGISFTTNQSHYPSGEQVNSTVLNLSSESIEVGGWSDLVAYRKEANGWVTQYPCHGSVILGNEVIIPSGDTWQIGARAFDDVTCIIARRRLLPPEEVEGIYMFSIGYHINSCNGADAPALVLYSNEFQVGEIENSNDDFEVIVEPSGFRGFSLHNHMNHPLWYIPPHCAKINEYDQHQGLLSASYVLQRQTDVNAWEVFYPNTGNCLETIDQISVEAENVLEIEAQLDFPYSPEEWPTGRYRWKVLYQPELSDWRLRHVFSPVFEYDGTKVIIPPNH